MTGNKLYPVMGLALGAGIGAIFAYSEKQKGALGYLVPAGVCGFFGLLLGFGVSPAPVKSAPLAAASAPDTKSSVSVDDKIAKLIDSIVSKNIKNAPVNAGNSDKVKQAIKQSFSDKEKGITVDILTVEDKMPANPTEKQFMDNAEQLTSVMTKYGQDSLSVLDKLNKIAPPNKKA